MQIIYNSEQYCVVEFGANAQTPALASGGYEIVDKTLQREIFIDGALAVRFRADLERLAATDPDADACDRLIGQFDGVMTQPVVLH